MRHLSQSQAPEMQIMVGIHPANTALCGGFLEDGRVICQYTEQVASLLHRGCSIAVHQ